MPVLDANYRASLEGAERAGRRESAPPAGRAAPGQRPPDDEQPFAYAARLEFGDADRAAEPSRVPPSTRPRRGRPGGRGRPRHRAEGGAMTLGDGLYAHLSGCSRSAIASTR